MELGNTIKKLHLIINNRVADPFDVLINAKWCADKFDAALLITALNFQM